MNERNPMLDWPLVTNADAIDDADWFAANPKRGYRR
jgi:hypothetical protein